MMMMMMNMRNLGHTPGLVIMQINLKESGTWIFTTDQYHVYENWESGIPQGWLARDHDDWVESDQMIKALQKVRVPPYLIFLVTHKFFLLYNQNEKGEREKKEYEHKSVMYVVRANKTTTQRTNAKMVFGHCADTFFSYQIAPHTYM